MHFGIILTTRFFGVEFYFSDKTFIKLGFRDQTAQVDLFRKNESVERHKQTLA